MKIAHLQNKTETQKCEKYKTKQQNNTKNAKKIKNKIISSRQANSAKSNQTQTSQEPNLTAMQSITKQQAR